MAKRKADYTARPYSLYGDSKSDESGWTVCGHYATAVEADVVARAFISVRAWSRIQVRDQNGRVLAEYPDSVRESWEEWMIERSAAGCEEYPGQKEAREKREKEGGAT